MDIEATKWFQKPRLCACVLLFAEANPLAQNLFLHMRRRLNDSRALAKVRAGWGIA